MSEDDNKSIDLNTYQLFSQEVSMFPNISTADIFQNIEIKDENEIYEYIIKLKERMNQMKESIENITKQTESISILNEDDNSIPRKEKMILLTELFNEVHLMCGEVRQIISHIRTFRQLEMKNENIQMISQAEEEINRVLQLLSKLKNDLHEKISNYIDSIERKRTSSQSKNLEEVSSKSPTETDYSIGTYSASSRVCADKAQIKFISDYIQTLVKSVEEIYNSLNALNHVNNTVEELKNKINDLRILERHLNRNEPLVKEIEFWLCHDFSKPTYNRGDNMTPTLKEQYENLCDIMSRTNSLLLYKNELLHKELDKFHSPCSSTKKDKTSRTDTKPTSSSSSEESLKKENKASAEDFKEYKKNRRKEKKDLLQDIDQALEKISKLSKIIENINQTIEDNRLVSITNDSVVAQQGYLFKMQVDLLKMHKKDYEWLIEFSNPTRLCRMEVPDQLLYQIMNLKVKWNTTQERISNAQESLAKIRELWILFEYYTVRIMLWSKALNLNAEKKNNEEWKREEKIIREKISRVKKIKKSLFHHTSDLSRSIIDKLWKDTESEFNALTAKL